MWNGPKAVCDQCMIETKLWKLLKRFDGAMVCSSCWEPRHPQERPRRPVKIRAYKNPRRDPNQGSDPEFRAGSLCSLLGMSSLPGYAVPGCSIPNRGGTYDIIGIPPATFGWTCTVAGSSSVIDSAVVGCSIVG